MKKIVKRSVAFLSLILGFSQVGFSQNIGELCTKDFYKRGNGLNPLIMSMKRTLSSVPDKNLTTTPKHLWTKGYVSNQVYRNGYEIYDLYAELIQMAEHEVLIEGMLFDINSPGARKIKEAIALLHEKRKKAGAKTPVTVRVVWDIIGSIKGLNLFELMTKVKFHGRRAGTHPGAGRRRRLPGAVPAAWRLGPPSRQDASPGAGRTHACPDTSPPAPAGVR